MEFSLAVQCHRTLFILIFALSSLVGCDDAWTFGGDSDSTISYEMIKFYREGGKCLGDPGVTEENEHCASVEISYPEIGDTPVAIMRDQLNDKIENILLSSSDAETNPESIEQLAYLFIQEYKKTANDTHANWNIKKSVKVLLNIPQLISFRIEESGYTGGAHGYSITKFLNVDTEIMQESKLSDLLLSGYEAELNISGEKVFRESRNLPPDADLEKSGFWFEGNTFALNDNFAVTKKGLLFYFNNYDIASYADGPTEILIPYSDIQNLIDPDGALSGFLDSTSSN